MSKLKKLFKSSVYIAMAFTVAVSLCVLNMTYAEDNEEPEITTEPELDDTTETDETITEITDETEDTSSDSETGDETEPPDETDDTGEEPTDEPPVNPAELQLSFTNYSLQLGQGVQLTASLVNSDAENPVIGFYSNNTKVARVDASGYIISTGVGQTEIVAYYDDLFAMAVITVTEEEQKPEFIILSKNEYLLKTGGTAQIEAELLPKEIADSYSFTYSSENPDIATVDENGIITAVKEGETEITVSVGDLSEKVFIKVSSETFYVTAKVDGYLYNSKGEAMAGSIVYIDGQAATVDKSGYFSFSAIDQKGVVISISDYPDIKCDFKVTKDDTIYLLSSESSLVTVSSIYELQGLLPINKVNFDSSSIVLNEGDVYSLNYTFLPQEATLTEIKYESSNPLVVQVGQIDGVILAKTAGDAVITLTVNGGQASVQLNVTVNPQESTKFSILIVVLEGILFLAAGTFVFMLYRKYKLKTESDLSEEEEKDEDIHDIE